MENYCYHHNVVFPNSESYDLHVESCNRIQSIKNICTFLNSEGQMCGEFFTHTVLLYEHVKLAHEMIICTHCDGVFITMDELSNHVHSNELNIHEGKFKINFLI